jgi:hypothetical protein
MSSSWIQKLKEFNEGGNVWAIPRKNTIEREMLNRGQRFKYKLPPLEPKNEVKINFPSDIEGKVKMIKKILFSGSYGLEDRKLAVKKALEILDYKENSVIQEARKPIQKEVVSFLNDINTNPIIKKYNVFGHNPASGRPDYRIIDNSDLKIPNISKGLVDEIKKEQKDLEKQRKKLDKIRSEETKKELEEYNKKQKELNTTIDVDAVKKEFGKYPDKLIEYYKKFGVSDSLDFDKLKNKFPKNLQRPQAVYGHTFWIDFSESYN